MNDELWTVKDVAKYLRVAEATVRYWVMYRKIPFRKINGILRFDRMAIVSWVEQSGRTPVIAKHAACL